MMSNEVQEYGVQIAGGAVHVRPAPEGENAPWIAAEHELGIRVLTRKVIVVEDWQELPPPTQ